MNFQDVTDYPLPAERVLAFFTSPAFYVRKYEEQGARNVRVDEHRASPEQFSITVSRDVPVEVDVPDFARSRIPQTITLVQTDQWDLARRTGSLQILFKGLPVKVSCSMRLTDTPSGAREELDFDIRVNVPLLGGKLEELLARDLRLKFARDTEVTLAIMAVAGA